jgi:amino acid transporter
LSATSSSQQLDLGAEGLDRKVGFFGLLWSSETSLIGSGWLFGALTATLIAGPAAIFGWVLATIIIALLALVHAELGGLFPVTGGTSRFPHYAFGSFAGATFGWASYLQAATVAPIEVLATIQYMSSFSWGKGWYVAQSTGPGTLSSTGILIAVCLMILFVVVNLFGIAWFSRINSVITVWKVAIPTITVVILLVGHFHGSNFGSKAGGFFSHNIWDSSTGLFVHASPIKTILLTLPAGIVFSLLGFEQAVQLAGEAKDPQKDVARAVIISLIIGATLYILIQIAFIGAADPHLLDNLTFKGQHGWIAAQNAIGQPAWVSTLNAGPFYAIASVAGVGWLASVLRADAIISPGGTGLTYTTSSSRLSYGYARNGFIPSAFERVNQRTKVPVFSVVLAAIVGLIFLLPFPSWAALVNVVTSASVLMYAAAPLALGALRRQKPDLPRPYRMPAANVIAPLSFMGATMVILFSGWSTYTTLMVAVLLGYLLVWLSYTFKANPNQKPMDWSSAGWIAGYFIGLLVIQYFGAFGSGGIIGGIGFFKNVLDHGGNDDLTLAGTLIAAGIWSLVIYYWAMRTRLPTEEVDRLIEEVYPAADAGGH